MKERIISHNDLNVFKHSFDAGMAVYHISKSFPKEEVYSLTDQIRRSSRSVSGNIAEAWRKRRYEKAFIAKLNDAEGEVAETQVWLKYSRACEYIDEDVFCQLDAQYEHIIGMIVNMIINPKKWIL